MAPARPRAHGRGIAIADNPLNPPRGSIHAPRLTPAEEAAILSPGPGEGVLIDAAEALVYPCEATVTAGIQLQSSTYNEIQQGNVLRGNLQHGIYLRDSWRNLIKANQVEGNRNGVSLDDSGGNNEFRENQIKANTENGVYAVNSYPASHDALLDNTIRDSKVGVYLNGACNLWVGVFQDGSPPVLYPNTIGPNSEAGIKVSGACTDGNWAAQGPGRVTRSAGRWTSAPGARSW